MTLAVALAEPHPFSWRSELDFAESEKSWIEYYLERNSQVVGSAAAHFQTGPGLVNINTNPFPSKKLRRVYVKHLSPFSLNTKFQLNDDFLTHITLCFFMQK